MPTTAFNGLRRVADGLAPDPTPDGELLARYANHGDGAAFDTLVRRHAGKVFGTCRRTLGNAADADDAFQATFVVLVRKAHSLTDRPGLGGFLHGVAFHTALKVRAMAAQRRTKEARAERPEPAADRSDVLAALDEELARLPEKYREPVVLCDLEGRSRRDAADSLGVPQGTISSRLATAHRMLEKRLRSRGFTGVCVAVLLAGHVSASTDALADAAIRAVLVPSKTVSFLAAEVSKMLLLHKFRLGVLVLSAVLVGIAAAVAATDTPPQPPPAAKGTPPQPPAAAVKEPAWKTEFRKAYGLRDGELIRRVPPPHPECRAEYFKDLLREVYKRNKIEPDADAVKQSYTDYFTKFGWKDGWPVDGLTMHTTPIRPEVGVRLVQLLHMTTGFPHTRTNGDAELLEQKVTGDFVVRADADPAKLAAALESILRKECELKVSLEVQEIERNVYVLSGKYESKPVAGRKKDRVEVYATELGDPKSGGGGTGSLKGMVEHIEGFIEYPIILGEVAGAPKRVEWHFNYRSPFTDQQRAEDTNPEAVMLNVSEQTGLTAKVEKRKIQVLVVKKAM